MDKSTKGNKRRVRRKCPTPNKFAYKKGIDAYHGLLEIMNKNLPGHNENRVYKCYCGRYHISSKEK